MIRYRILPHTADARVRAYGHTMPGVFENCAFGLLKLMKLSPGCRTGDSTEIRKIRLKARGSEDLLVRWLNEIIFLVQADGFLPSDIKVENCRGCVLKASVKGRTNRGGPPAGREVKAATYHGLEIKNTGGKLTAEVLFDL
ncbi:MAG: archease [bacterium]